MKKTVLILLAAALALGGASPTFAQRTGRQGGAAQTANPYAGILQSYRTGGEGMVGAVTDVLTNNPNAIGAIVALAKSANPEQKAAIALAILRALALLDTSNPQGAQTIRLALVNLDPTTAAIFAALQTQLYAQSDRTFGRGNSLFYPGGGGGFSGGQTGGGGYPVSNH